MVAWLLGAAGALYLLRGRPAGSLYHRMVHVLWAALAGLVLVISIHWLLINVFSLLPEDVPDPVLMWLVPAVAAVPDQGLSSRPFAAPRRTVLWAFGPPGHLMAQK